MLPLSRARAAKLLKAMRGRRVLVLGDAMLDEFIWGRVARISPEAPVPVVQVTETPTYLYDDETPRIRTGARHTTSMYEGASSSCA